MPYLKYYIVGLIAVLLISVIFVAGLIFLNHKYDVYVLKEIGYDTKLVGMDCFAKYNDRWVSCYAVVNNQVEIVKGSK